MRSSEAAVQDSCQCRFRIPGIGACMSAAIFPYKKQQRKPARSNYHEESRQAGGNIVGRIVQMGSKTSETTVTLILIPYHRVKCVYHFISKHSRNTQQCVPKQRSNNAVAQILRQRLQRSRTNFLSRKSGGVASHNAGHLLPSLFQ